MDKHEAICTRNFCKGQGITKMWFGLKLKTKISGLTFFISTAQYVSDFRHNSKINSVIVKNGVLSLDLLHDVIF